MSILREIRAWTRVHPIQFYAVIAAFVLAVAAVIILLVARAKRKNGEAAGKIYDFFRKRCTFLLGAAILGIIAFFAYQLIINGHIGSANRQTGYGAESVGRSIGEGLAGLSLVPAMIITIVSTLFCWVGWIFRQRWAALVGAIGFGVALVIGLTRFYVPIIPMGLAIFSFVRTRDWLPEAPAGETAAGEKEAPAPAAAAAAAPSSAVPAEELKKLKELLDAGVITQEEFEAKKKQLLGI